MRAIKNSLFYLVKFAIIDLFLSIVIVHVPDPVQAPSNPVKNDPAPFALAFTYTISP